MALVAIRLLGTEALRHGVDDGAAICDAWWPLLGCLVAAPAQGLTRDLLAAELWPDSDGNAARRSLATALWRIRAHPAGQRAITLSGDRVKLDRHGRWWLDALVFDRRVTAALAAPARLDDVRQRRRLRHALGLYKGDLLPTRTQESIVIERERFRALYLDGLYALAGAEARMSEWELACRTARQLCICEPLREDAQRLLIEALARTGCRALALQQYRGLRTLLDHELQVAPMPETTALVKRLVGDEPAAPTAPAAPGAAILDGRSALGQIRAQLTTALALVDMALAG